MTNARSITNSVRKALRADNLLDRTTTKTQADFRFVTKGGKRVQVPVFRTVVEVKEWAALIRVKLRHAGFDVSVSESPTYVIVYTPREIEPVIETPVVVEPVVPVVEKPAVRAGGWYLVPAEGERLTDRHELLGPYTTQGLAEHLRKTYAAEGIKGEVVQSVTRPVLAPREIAVDLGTLTLAGLVDLRRAAAEVFRRQERPTDDEIVSAANTIDTIDAELDRRDWQSVRNLLIDEGSLLVAKDHAERKGGTLDAYQATDLRNVISSIAGILRLKGTTDGR